MRKVAILSILLIFGGFALAQSVPYEEQIKSGADVMKQYYPLVVLAIIATFSVGALAYAFSKVLALGSLRSWAKDQIYQGFISLLIGVVVVYVYENFMLSQSTFISLLSNAKLIPDECLQYGDAFTISTCELGQFLKKADNLMWALFSYDVIINTLSSCVTKFDFPSQPESSPLSIRIVVPIGNTLAVDISGILTRYYGAVMILMIFTSFQYYLILSSPYIFLLLFPAGVVLRSFGVTRNLGSSMIALAVGISIFYPLLTSLFYGYVLVYYKTSFADFVTSIIGKLSIFNTITAQFVDKITGLGWVIGIVNAVLILGPLFFNLFAPGHWIIPYIIGLVIIPYFIFDIVENFIRGTARVMGGEASILNAITKFL